VDWLAEISRAIDISARFMPWSNFHPTAESASLLFSAERIAANAPHSLQTFRK
jgi:hypothetical protein